MRRVVFMMLDGVGVGALPDAPAYGDAGSDTLGNLSRVVALDLPNLRALGLGNIAPIVGVPPVEQPRCLVGRLAPLSAGKDTTVGHWEHMGLVTEHPFPTYPKGFPQEVVAPFENEIGRRVLGNRPASGTAIMAELGEEHVSTGRPIVYTSADSVFQIATHVDVVPLEQLYAWCEAARRILVGPHAVARVIARPFTGPAGAFVRTKDRRDFSLAPPGPLYLDLLQEKGVPVLALGKISEIFAGRGVSTKIKIGSNDENLSLILDLLRGTSEKTSFEHGLLFTNLVDFDMVWGHRNDPEGFAAGMAAVDAALPAILELLRPDDRLIISADHGVDPTTVSTDHSREYVPFLFYSRVAGAPAAVYEGTFSDTGATIFHHLVGGETPLRGIPASALRPVRGWRRYTPSQPSPSGSGADLPGRVGPIEALEAADWLHDRFGAPPGWAVVLGSGLADTFLLHGLHPVRLGHDELTSPATIAYDAVPHWRAAGVSGHPGVLSVVDMAGEKVAILAGRIHGYEGFDLSETQLTVRTLAAWGVHGVILSSAAGAVSHSLAAGDLVLVHEVVDFQITHGDGSPTRLAGTDVAIVQHVSEWRGPEEAPRLGVHAVVPGPHYETRREVEALERLGVDSVSMSLASEVRAAREEGLTVAAFAVISNAGPPSHEEVLSATAAAGRHLAQTAERLLVYMREGAPS